MSQTGNWVRRANPDIKICPSLVLVQWNHEEDRLQEQYVVIFTVHYLPRESYVKVMFSVVSVCLAMWGFPPNRAPTHPAQDPPLGQVKTCSDWTSLYKDIPPTHPPRHVLSCSLYDSYFQKGGRLAFDWKSFLFKPVIITWNHHFRKNICKNYEWISGIIHQHTVHYGLLV